jgi:hypothetical protein
MSQRDGSGKNKYNDDRTGGFGSDDQPPEPESRRSSAPEYDDEVDLPAWGTQRSRSTSRDSAQQSGTAKKPSRYDRDVASSSSGHEPIPTLGDAFEPGSRRSTPPSSRSSPTSSAPIERQRRTTTSPEPSSSGRQQPSYEEQYLDPYLVDEYGDPYIEERPPRTRRRPVADSRTAPRRPSSTQQIGGMIAAAGLQTRLLAAVGGFSIVSLVLMAATLLGRLDTLPDWIPIHLNAEGEPDFWGTASTLWRIPLMTFVLTVMSASVAWYLWKRDPFAARFTLGSTVLINVLSWIAIINFVW